MRGSRRGFPGRLAPAAAALALVAQACGGGGAGPAGDGALLLLTTQPLGELSDAPGVIALDGLDLDFSAPLDGASVAAGVRLEVARPGGAWAEDPLVEVSWSAASPGAVRIRPRTGTELPQGQEWRLTVTTALRAATGRTVPAEFRRYLATGYRLDLQAGIPALGGARSVLYVVSDVHMGDARAIDGHHGDYGWFDENRAHLSRFLDLARDNPNLKEVVVAGDLFDGWVVPMALPPLGEKAGVAGSLATYVDDVAAANAGVFASFRGLMDPGQVTVTWVPGNHDMLIPIADVDRHLPKLHHARDRKGLGAYTPPDHPEIVIEHGHRYDFFNAPDPISNLDVTGGGSILPPGFWVSRIAATHTVQRGRSACSPCTDCPTPRASPSEAGYDLYLAAWLGILAVKPVDDCWLDPVILTGIDGYRDPYAILDLVPLPSLDGWDVTLYARIEDTWRDRQDANGVAVPIEKEVAMAASAIGLLIDAQASVQYFRKDPPSDTRIVVFGHTHEVALAGLRTRNDRSAIYANSGTWTDHREFCKCMTFVVIVPPTPDRVITTVSTYRYVDGKPVEIASKALGI